MTFVPMPVHVHTPSHQTQELADKLARVIVDYEQAHPRVSSAEVREAARLALQVARPGGGLDRQMVSMLIGVAVLLVGAVFYAMSSGMINLPAGPFPVIAGIALVGLVLPLIALLRRGKL